MAGIRRAVRLLHGIGNITGDAKAKTLTVEYEPATVSVDAIQRAVDEAGYDSEVAT